MSRLNFIILGGGVTGWTVASSLANALLKTPAKIVVIELDNQDADSWQDTNGAEILSPETQILHETLAIDEKRLLDCAGGTFSYGSRFSGWHTGGEFFHAYGRCGVDFDHIGFHHFYTKFKQSSALPRYDHFSLSALAGLNGRFTHPSSDPATVTSTLAYGLHLDSAGYADFLKNHAVNGGVITQRSKFQGAVRADDGSIAAVMLEDGNTVDGDFFIDCSGAQAHLINGVLGVKRIAWSDFFSANRTVSYSGNATAAIPSCALLSAHTNSWVRSVPLVHKCANTIVFNDDYVSTQAVLDMTGADDAVAHPLLAGHQQYVWHKNVIAFGAAACVFEPLGFSGMDILYHQIQCFLSLLPVNSRSELNAKEYNRRVIETCERIRDYHLCHYALASPSGELWKFARVNSLPDTLAHGLNLFRERGMVAFYDSDIVSDARWISLFMGFGVTPARYDPRADALNDRSVQDKIFRIQQLFAQAAIKMPAHADYRMHYLRAQSFAQ